MQLANACVVDLSGLLRSWRLDSTLLSRASPFPIPYKVVRNGTGPRRLIEMRRAARQSYYQAFVLRAKLAARF